MITIIIILVAIVTNDNNKLCNSYPCPCPSQFVAHVQLTHGYSMKFVELFWAGVWV